MCVCYCFLFLLEDTFCSNQLTYFIVPYLYLLLWMFAFLKIFLELYEVSCVVSVFWTFEDSALNCKVIVFDAYCTFAFSFYFRTYNPGQRFESFIWMHLDRICIFFLKMPEYLAETESFYNWLMFSQNKVLWHWSCKYVWNYVIYWFF